MTVGSEPSLKLHTPPPEKREFIGQPEAYRRFADMIEAERLRVAPGTERSR